MVRVAKAEDVLPITLIARLTLEDAYAELLNEDVQSQFIDTFYNAETIETLIANQNILVVDNDDNLSVGFLSLSVEGDVCEIVSLYILPRFQHLGYGSLLLKSILDHDGFKEFYTDIESRNIPTQKFYAKHKFELDHSYPQDLYGQPLKITRLRYVKDE